jgi:hypothetical protein
MIKPLEYPFERTDRFRECRCVVCGWVGPTNRASRELHLNSQRHREAIAVRDK